MEIWKQIEKLKGYYISNYGRVKADCLITKFGNNKKKTVEKIFWNGKGNPIENRLF